MAAQVLVSAQVLAAATAPCPMMAEHHPTLTVEVYVEAYVESLQDHSLHLQHSSHHPRNKAEIEPSAAMPVMECCGEESCPMLACVSVAALPNLPLTRFAPVLANIADNYHFSVVPLISSSPFRPPIRTH